MVVLDIFDLWRSLIGNVNTQQGGHIKPQGNFQNWVNEISMELYREKIAKWELNQMISDELSPFVKTVNGVLVVQQGKSYDLLPYPTDYGYFSSARILQNAAAGCGCMIEGAEILDGKTGKCGGWEDPDYAELKEIHKGDDLCELSVTKIPNQMWGNACNDSFKKPTPEQPIITQFDGGFKVAPKKLGVIILDYLKLPRKAVFGYTLGVDDNIVYNAGTSVQLEWGENMKGEFLARLQKRYAMFVREDFVYQASEQERQINK